MLGLENASGYMPGSQAVVKRMEIEMNKPFNPQRALKRWIVLKAKRTLPGTTRTELAMVAAINRNGYTVKLDSAGTWTIHKLEGITQ